jgi:hypothetical protein
MTKFSNQFTGCMFNSKGPRAKMAAFELTAMDAPLRCHCHDSDQILRVTVKLGLSGEANRMTQEREFARARQSCPGHPADGGDGSVRVCALSHPVEFLFIILRQWRPTVEKERIP